MKITAIVEALVLAGATPDMILSAVRAAERGEGEASAAKREAARQRQIKHRANSRHVMSRDVTVTERDSCDNAEKRNENNDAVTLQPGDPRARVENISSRLEITGKEDKDISSASVDREFAETFWSAYPLKRDRGHALKAFRSARKRVPLATIMTGVHRYATERAGDDPKFTKYAQGWLNGDGWADEPRPKVDPRATAPPSQPKKLTKATMWIEEAREFGIIPNEHSHEIDGRLETSLSRGPVDGDGFALSTPGPGDG